MWYKFTKQRRNVNVMDAGRAEEDRLPSLHNSNIKIKVRKSILMANVLLVYVFSWYSKRVMLKVGQQSLRDQPWNILECLQSS